MFAMNDLKGQVAVVSGSTSGIGLALARAVAQCGGDVVLNGLGDPAVIEQTRADLAAETGVRVLYHPADMTQPDQIAAILVAAMKEREIAPATEIAQIAGGIVGVIDQPTLIQAARKMGAGCAASAACDTFWSAPTRLSSSFTAPASA